MDKKVRKEDDTMCREALHRILDLVLDINGMQASKKQLTGDHPTAFMRIDGHTAGADVDIHSDGWFPGSDPDEKITCYFDGSGLRTSPMEMERKLREIADAMSIIDKDGSGQLRDREFGMENGPQSGDFGQAVKK